MLLKEKKYTDIQLADIKANVSLLEIFKERGFVLTKRGKDYAALCPFHDDTEPSLIISPDKNLFNCFGCHAGGDVIEFVMKYEGKTFIEAVDALLNKSCFLTTATKNKKEIATEAQRHGERQSVKNQKLLNRVMEFYHSTFREDKRGEEYLRSRGITDPKLYDTFKLGFANGSLFKTIPESGEIIESLQELGLLSEKKHELFSNCVIFPVVDKNGQVVHAYGRKITDEKIKHLYLPGQHQGLFNYPALKTDNQIILTESIIDSLSLYQIGIKNSIPCYGVNGLTEDHIKAFKDYNTAEIIILFDGDKSGRESAQCIKDTLESYSFSCRIVELPDGEDPNSYVQNHSLEEIEKLIYGAAKKNNELTIKPHYSEDGFSLELCQRKYMVRGIEGSKTKLKANIRAINCSRFHIDTVDLYLAKSRQSFIKEAGLLFKENPEIIETDLNQLITLSEEYLQKQKQEKPIFHISEEDRKEALSFGKQANLISEIVKDIEKCGYIGEEMNKLLSYLAMTSRKMNDPLSILIISGSGAGKSSLQDTILNLCPDEELVKLTSLTGKALFYKSESSLKNKVLAIEEEQGAQDADYAIRNLISSKVLSIEATIKDNATGKITTMENKVSGPTSVFKTTTNPDTDPETKSRFITISVDESREQTKRILDYQRQSFTLEGHLGKQLKNKIIKKHQNFQRLLKPLAVFNPYSKLLTYSDDRILVRRENPKYLNIINTVAFLHQFQRPVKEIKKDNQVINYIEVTLEDIQIANEIAHNILGKSLNELSTPSRNLLNVIHDMVCDVARENKQLKENIIFTRRKIREYTKWSDYQVRTHLKQLVDLEYLMPVSGKHGSLFSYRLLYNGEGSEREHFVIGLKNIRQVKKESEQLGIK